MASDLTAAEVENAVRALVTAEKTNLGIEVTVPVAYADGALVSVVIEQTADAYVVHDAGFSSMRLTGIGVSLSRGVNQRLMDFASRYRTKFINGRVQSTATIQNLAQVICLVANAARSVADYAHEIKRQAESDFRLIVFDTLRELVGDRVRETEEFKGKSGRRYRVPILLDVTKTRPQNFLSTLAQRNTVPQSFAMLYDLGAAYPNVERDAVYDETADLREEDRLLLQSAGASVFGWDRFRELIHNAQRIH
jgi:hypothetical protein